MPLLLANAGRYSPNHSYTMLSVYLILLGAVAANAALNGPCTVSGTPGVCIKTSSCSSSGGTSHTGFCPNDPADVKCCTKPSCGNNGGKCQFANTCASGKTVTGKSYLLLYTLDRLLMRCNYDRIMPRSRRFQMLFTRRRNYSLWFHSTESGLLSLQSQLCHHRYAQRF